MVNADNSVRLWVNGQSARKQNDTPWSESVVVDLTPFLRPGTNTFAFEAVNGGETPNPAGLLFYARLRVPAKDNGSADLKAAETVLDFGSDGSWLVATNKAEGWMKPEFDVGTWTKAQVLDRPGWGRGISEASLPPQ